MIKRSRPRPNGMKMNRPHQNGHSNPNQHSKYDDRNEVRLKNRSYYQQMHEKYASLARESLSLGDRVEAEGYFQYAEHYLRQLNDRIRYDNDVQQSQQQRFAVQQQQAAERNAQAGTAGQVAPAQVASVETSNDISADDGVVQNDGDDAVSVPDAPSEVRTPRRRVMRSPHRRHVNVESKTVSTASPSPAAEVIVP